MSHVTWPYYKIKLLGCYLNHIVKFDMCYESYWPSDNNLLFRQIMNWCARNQKKNHCSKFIGGTICVHLFVHPRVFMLTVYRLFLVWWLATSVKLKVKQRRRRRRNDYQSLCAANCVHLLFIRQWKQYTYLCILDKRNRPNCYVQFFFVQLNDDADYLIALISMCNGNVLQWGSLKMYHLIITENWRKE